MELNNNAKKLLRQIFLLVFLFVFAVTDAQEIFQIEGQLLDAETNQPIAYASIGIIDSPLGTSSNSEGYFILKARYKEKIRIKISSIGYESLVIENPKPIVTLKVKPSKMVLKEVVVLGKNASPESIVRKAFHKVKKNYFSSSLIYQTFYRHYCKDDSVYGRLIEAAVEIYKKKGHRVQRPEPGWKEQIRVTQLRKSYDNSKVSSVHMPIALYSVMGSDPVSYQARDSVSPVYQFFSPHAVSRLKRSMKMFSFSLDGTTEYDGEEVYIISYKLKSNSLPSDVRKVFVSDQSGTLFVTTKDYAIIKSEFLRESSLDTLKTFTTYRKLNGKYFLAHSMKEGRTYHQRDKFTHNYHLELTTTNVLTKNYTAFKGKEPDRLTILKMDYDSSFWKHYNILKATPLEESIVKDLEKSQALSGQFKEANLKEREWILGGRQDEEKFNQYLIANRGKRPVYVDFWASWCGPCIKEMTHAKKIIDKYQDKVGFVYLSIDENIEAWKKAIKKYEIAVPYSSHFRIGNDSDAAILFDLESIPRYVLFDKEGKVAHLYAKRPSDKELEKDLNQLIIH
jgi:thiol-disulfide isomerase/thioredoxin